MPSTYLSLPAAAQQLGYSVNSLRRLAEQGVLTFYRATPTSHPRVKQSDLDALMKATPTLQPAPTLEEAWAYAEEMRNKRQSLH